MGDEATTTAALEAGANILIAQAGEAGGEAGWVGTLASVPRGSTWQVMCLSSLPAGLPTAGE